MGIYGHKFDKLIDLQRSENLNEGFFSNLKKKKEEKKAEKERLRKEAADKTLLEILNMTLKFVKTPFTLGDGYDSDVITILHHLGMSSDSLGLFLSKNKGSLNKMKLDYWFDTDLEIPKDQVKKINSGLSFLENDDYVAFVSLIDNKLYHNWAEGKTFIAPYKFEELFAGDWSDYKEVSKKNGDILDQIEKIISKYK